MGENEGAQAVAPGEVAGAEVLATRRGARGMTVASSLSCRASYFVGLHFLYALSSSMIHGVGRDAARISEAVAARVVPIRASNAQATTKAA